MSSEKAVVPASITVLVPAGLLPANLLNLINQLSTEYGFGLYLSTAQNLRLLDLRPEDVAAVKARLLAAGAELKAPGRFPKAKVCVGKSHCNLGLVDTFALAERLALRFREVGPVKPKLKIAVSGCPAACSNPLLADIGVKAGPNGFDLYAGGKGGTNPKVGRRIKRQVGEEEVLATMAELLAFHERKTAKKQRMSKLLADPEFPFPEV